MSHRTRQHILPTALIGLWGLCMFAHPAWAAPPLNKMAAQLMHSTGDRSEAAVSVKLPKSRLDLALPAGSGYERTSAAEFPAPQRKMWSMESLKASLPNLGSAGVGSGATPRERIMSQPEILVRNFKREGLPVARLFQSENSLVHLGLNPKGKPGLWIIEKLH